MVDEDRHSSRRIRDAYQRGKPSDAQADDRDRGEAHSLAHHEHLWYPGNISINLSNGKTVVYDGKQPDWKVHIVDTGLHTQTGGRIKRLEHWLGEDRTFMLTYGDGLCDVKIRDLLEFHRSHGKLATVTTVLPPGRFGRIALDDNVVSMFNEKPEADQGWINGGFFVLERRALDYIQGDETIWERDPLEMLSRDGQLMGYRHRGFWSCMDTLKEKNILEKLWQDGKAPWKIW
jgi:glucose-1-phosphate cytidylyltransferase